MTWLRMALVVAISASGAACDSAAQPPPVDAPMGDDSASGTDAANTPSTEADAGSQPDAEATSGATSSDADQPASPDSATPDATGADAGPPAPDVDGAEPTGWPDAPPEGLAEYLKQIAAAVEVPLILSGSDRHSPATEILDMSDFIRPGANAGPDCDDCDIATLKQLVRGKIESYPAAVRPPLSSLP